MSEKSEAGQGAANKTLDGKRLRLGEVVKSSPPKSGIRRLLYNINLFLAGMYTGESCAGTPHSERNKDKERKDD